MLTLTHSCYTTKGNLSSLEPLTQLTKVDFNECKLVEGNMNRSHESTQHNGLGHISRCCLKATLERFWNVLCDSGWSGRVFESNTSPHLFF